MIDGWFLYKRWSTLKPPWSYNGPNIRKYCKRHLRSEFNDVIYRIFYYDTRPLDKRGHHPLSGLSVNFAETPTANAQNQVLDSLRKTPQVALRLGRVEWRDKAWIINPSKTKDLCKNNLSLNDLTEWDVRPDIKQKTVDMKLGLDIAVISLKKLADVMVVIAGDEDVVPALKLARTEGMLICLDPLRNHITTHLEEHVDFVSTYMPKPNR